MKNLNKYDYIFLGGLALWLIETMAFGWNLTAHSVPERIFDNISGALMLYGFVAGITTAAFCRTIIHTKEVNL